MKTKELTTIQEIGQYGLNNLEAQQDGVYACDLHHHLYNEGYFIVGSYKAEQFLNKYGAFKAIGEVQQYEKDNFGEVATDLSSPEKVANMLAYIVGGELLNSCPTVLDKWDERLTEKDLKKIKKELAQAIKNF